MTERNPDYYEEAGLTRDQVTIMILSLMSDHLHCLPRSLSSGRRLTHSTATRGEPSAPRPPGRSWGWWGSGCPERSSPPSWTTSTWTSQASSSSRSLLSSVQGSLTLMKPSFLSYLEYFVEISERGGWGMPQKWIEGGFQDLWQGSIICSQRNIYSNWIGG